MKYPDPIAKTGCKKFILQNTLTIKEINSIIDNILPKDVNSLSTENYRNLLLKIQNEVNENKFHHIIAFENKNFFDTLFLNNKYFITSVAHIRGVRPSSNEPLEYVGLHRENFYADGDYINHQINIQIPIRNYNVKTSMFYLPKSHLILDSELKLKKMDSSFSKVEKFSSGHKIGLSYNPKLIESGLNRTKLKRVNLQPNQGFAFSTRLIHGGGSNLTNKTRFSMDFGLIPYEKVSKAKSKHFASYSKNNSPYESVSRIN